MFRILTAAALASLVTGCTPLENLLEGQNDIAIAWADTGYAYESNATGTMRGEMPDNGNFDRSLSHASIYRFDDAIEFDLHSLDGSWAMVGGGFSLRAPEEGQTVVLDPADHWIIGCSGPSEYDAAFDESAETVEVQVDRVEVDGQAMVEFTITASFGSAGEVTTVVVQPAPEETD